MRAIDGDRLLRELTALSHGQVWLGWTCEGIRLLIERQPTLTQPNEPLTLEQLREMVGKPVYIIANDMGIAEWNVIAGKDLIHVGYDVPFNGMMAVKEALKFINGRSFRLDTYGTSWLVYFRPPEGEANE